MEIKAKNHTRISWISILVNSCKYVCMHVYIHIKITQCVRYLVVYSSVQSWHSAEYRGFQSCQILNDFQYITSDRILFLFSLLLLLLLLLSLLLLSSLLVILFLLLLVIIMIIISETKNN